MSELRVESLLWVVFASLWSDAFTVDDDWSIALSLTDDEFVDVVTELSVLVEFDLESAF
ncbi:hypothetical protein FD35_GL001828 [Furfurilactobacillus rossiae DSM 15814]|uniref:Uncharacterized protein n=1 Tax=Furfurilactobacillus rossiae DSM 15814 TaxID=1114972 RepID=A0A0R1RGW4_9LACO|nr:hypothetical protein FD35_GL001828 [Furfurilactobacillus rossiae DSM 15814]